MTTAHRPTFDPARGKEAQRGPAYHQRLQPAYTKLKFRKPGQGGNADVDSKRDILDLRADLLAAEAAHYAKLHGGPALFNKNDANSVSEAESGLPKRPLEIAAGADGDDVEDATAKRRRILEETRDIDADSDWDEEDEDQDSDDDSSDDEDAALERELERVRHERMMKKEQEERERATQEDEAREREIARGNPLLNKPDFNMKRRWDDDVVFKNQARGTEEKGKKKEFINFMGKYVR
ncbi:hypothetical protein P8C59_004873 [Phyllachora maydis]|uniref:Cwf15/Cwc15 cell cycle control protein n=1 Tax=Phyllachora maydis TaxID=1825666 RepID=A0AAD9I4D6_9PEZI|nr:hypothetical protein P8C59_004873 [Phyllachora maydis]